MASDRAVRDENAGKVLEQPRRSFALYSSVSVSVSFVYDRFFTKKISEHFVGGRDERFESSRTETKTFLGGSLFRIPR